VTMIAPYYEDDAVTIYHGDARDVLPELVPQVDLLLTDPPYANISADGVRQGVRVVRQALFAAAPLLAPDAHLLVFCHWQSWPDFYDAVSSYAKMRNALIWYKNAGGQGNVRTDYFRDYEVILYGTRGTRELGGQGSYSAVLSGFARPGTGDRLHPTQKPEKLLRHLIGRHCPPTGIVLDPFMGSGSTLLAAKNGGCRAIGVEIEERYCEVAAKRCAQDLLFGEVAA
jgi:site-specific DNA-methyltransferase (adenine-specific)